jgi:von Willebrand factor type A domain
MRRLIVGSQVLLLAIFVAGCGSNPLQNEASRDGSDAPRAEGGGAATGRAAPMAPARDLDSAAPVTPKAPAREPDAAAPKAIIDDAHAGVEKRKKPEPEMPSGIITAGSFDDNAFPQFFRRFVAKAGQNSIVGSIAGQLTGRRVEITVKNGQGLPVADARVRVASADGKGIDLITRTDGRAIFLSSLDVAESDKALTATASLNGRDPISQPIDKDSDRCTIVMPTAPGVLPRNLDLAIVLDTTGSMGDEMEFLKSEVKNIAAAVKARFPNVNQRYALICYKDEGNADPYVVRVFDFTGNLDEFHRNLANQTAGGGGDIPEAVHRGLEEAVNLRWREADTARVLFLIGDAPPHPRHANNTLSQINALRKKGVTIYPVFASNNETVMAEATEIVMRAAALVTGGQYIFLTDDSGVGSGHAEPHIPFFHIEKLNLLIVRMIAGELAGKRLEPDSKSIIRTVGTPPNREAQD